MQALGSWPSGTNVLYQVNNVRGLIHQCRPRNFAIISTIALIPKPAVQRTSIPSTFSGPIPSLNSSRILSSSSLKPLAAQNTPSRNYQLIQCRHYHRPTMQHPQFMQQRNLWSPSQAFSKWMGPSKPIPSPLLAARVMMLERAVNANPNNLEKHIALWQSLVALDLKTGYDRITSRWERLLALDPSHPLIKSDEAFKLYTTALVKTGQYHALPSAVARRDQVLSSLPTSETVPTLDNSLPQQPTQPKAVPQTTISLATSPSQAIADSVLTAAQTQPNPSALGPLSPPGATGEGHGNKYNPVHVIVEQPAGSWAWSIAKNLAMFALYGFIALTILSIVLENSGLMKTGPNVTEFEQDQSKPVKFSDVHGVDEAKEELQDIVAFLKDPASFASLGGKLPKGVLLTGPPGTGKTLLAKAVAGEAGVPFFFASGSEFDEIFVGVGAKRIRELFAAARKKQPAIIFIDELDAIGGKRSPKDQQWSKQTLNQMLVELDGFSPSDGIIVLAATNFEQSLDKALVRPGRFDRKIPVPLPDVKGRAKILKHHMGNVKTAPDVDVASIAKGTIGFSGAELQNLVNQAAIQATKEGYKQVEYKHFNWAIDKIIMGPEQKTAAITEDDKRKTAYHEGGHALAAIYTQAALPVRKVTCIKRGNALGFTAYLPEGDRTSVTFKEFLAELDTAMGGRAAEEIIYGKENISSGASSDIRHASQTARNMVRHWGFSDKIGTVNMPEDEANMLSPKMKDTIEEEVRRLVSESYTRVLTILKERETELHRLADALVKYETLDGDEVKKVIKGEQIRGGEDPTAGI